VRPRVEQAPASDLKQESGGAENKTKANAGEGEK